MSRSTFDSTRREFLTQVGLAAGGVAVGSLVPLPALGSVPGAAAQIAAPAEEVPVQDEGWDIDAACGHFPPYAYPIPYGRPAVPVMQLADIDPIAHILSA